MSGFLSWLFLGGSRLIDSVGGSSPWPIPGRLPGLYQGGSPAYSWAAPRPIPGRLSGRFLGGSPADSWVAPRINLGRFPGLLLGGSPAYSWATPWPISWRLPGLFLGGSLAIPGRLPGLFVGGTLVYSWADPRPIPGYDNFGPSDDACFTQKSLTYNLHPPCAFVPPIETHSRRAETNTVHFMLLVSLVSTAAPQLLFSQFKEHDLKSSRDDVEIRQRVRYGPFCRLKLELLPLVRIFGASRDHLSTNP
ncbi:hypothetical protein Bbelb_043630 [Branchiostoma belcheri]|nr:hypothetical protein Bbelb_043630 [Branchiostoma belcheri]